MKIEKENEMNKDEIVLMSKNELKTKVGALLSSYVNKLESLTPFEAGMLDSLTMQLMAVAKDDDERESIAKNIEKFLEKFAEKVVGKNGIVMSKEEYDKLSVSDTIKLMMTMIAFTKAIFAKDNEPIMFAQKEDEDITHFIDRVMQEDKDLIEQILKIL